MPSKHYDRVVEHEDGAGCVTTEGQRLPEWSLPDRLAAYITEHFFVVAPRTVGEAWPLPHIIINKKTCIQAAALSYAQRVLDAAVACAVQGGRLRRRLLPPRDSDDTPPEPPPPQRAIAEGGLDL